MIQIIIPQDKALVSEFI